MMKEILIVIMSLVHSNFVVLMAGAFVWGLFSVCFSSAQLKHYSIVLEHMNGSQNMSKRRGLMLSVLLSIAVMLVTLTISFITILAGQMIGNIGISPKYSASIILLIFGAYMLELIPIPSVIISPGNIPKLKGYVAAFFDGLSAVALCLPCLFLFLTPLLSMIIVSHSPDILRFAMIISAYAVGQFMIIAFLGVFYHPTKCIFARTSDSSFVALTKKALGGILVLFGIGSVI